MRSLCEPRMDFARDRGRRDERHAGRRRLACPCLGREPAPRHVVEHHPPAADACAAGSARGARVAHRPGRGGPRPRRRSPRPGGRGGRRGRASPGPRVRELVLTEQRLAGLGRPGLAPGAWRVPLGPGVRRPGWSPRSPTRPRRPTRRRARSPGWPCRRTRPRRARSSCASSPACCRPRSACRPRRRRPRSRCRSTRSAATASSRR